MKTYKSFKPINQIRSQADCYMVGLWKDEARRLLAIDFFELYFKNWKTGLTTIEWHRAKELTEFWKQESIL